MAYLVRPYNTVTGAKAPSIISHVEKKELAKSDAEGKSRLSDFKNWNFTDIEFIKEKVINKFKKDEDNE